MVVSRIPIIVRVFVRLDLVVIVVRLVILIFFVTTNALMATWIRPVIAYAKATTPGMIVDVRKRTVVRVYKIPEHVNVIVVQRIEPAEPVSITDTVILTISVAVFVVRAILDHVVKQLTLERLAKACHVIPSVVNFWLILVVVNVDQDTKVLIADVELETVVMDTKIWILVNVLVIQDGKVLIVEPEIVHTNTVEMVARIQTLVNAIVVVFLAFQARVP